MQTRSKKKSSNTRNVNIDLIKALASLFVVTLHVSNQSMKIHSEHNLFNQLAYITAICAVPLFFMTNGYFLLNKEKLDYLYISKKILGIILVMVLWSTLYSVIHLFLNKEFVNIFQTMFLGVTKQGGKFINFWFLGTLIILFSIAPILNWILKKSNLYYFLLLLILFTLCLAFKHTPQITETFRIWTFLFYYMLGGLFGNNDYIKLPKNFSLVFFLISFIFLATITMYKTLSLNNYVWSNLNYNNISVILYCVSIFLFINNLNLKLDIFT